MKQIRLKIKTKKFNFDQDCNIDIYPKIRRKLKRIYKADEIYIEGNKYVAYYKVTLGTFESKRIDGVKI